MANEKMLFKMKSKFGKSAEMTLSKSKGSKSDDLVKVVGEVPKEEEDQDGIKTR